MFNFTATNAQRIYEFEKSILSQTIPSICCTTHANLNYKDSKLIVYLNKFIQVWDLEKWKTIYYLVWDYLVLMQKINLRASFTVLTVHGCNTGVPKEYKNKTNRVLTVVFPSNYTNW